MSSSTWICENSVQVPCKVKTDSQFRDIRRLNLNKILPKYKERVHNIYTEWCKKCDYFLKKKKGSPVSQQSEEVSTKLLRLPSPLLVSFYISNFGHAFVCAKSN